MTIEILYIIGCIVGLSAVVPQLKKVYRAKTSRELSLKTYATWMITSSITFIYVLSINATLLAITSAIWVLYYVAMVVMIVHYRNPQTKLSLDPVLVKENPNI